LLVGLIRRSRASGNPGLQGRRRSPLGPRFRGGDNNIM
jgi:hypothetical protein